MAQLLRFLAPFIAIVCLNLAHAQGTFIYDQRSSYETNLLEGTTGIQSNQPMGQSFTPTLSSIGFIRLWLYDGAFPNGVPGSAYINLRSGSINGPILGSTSLVPLPANSVGFTDFIFDTPVALTPGTQYYFQPVLQDSLSRGLNQANYFYAGGTLILNGQPDPRDRDLWFREGIIIPEPSVVSLILLSVGIFAWRKRKCGTS